MSRDTVLICLITVVGFAGATAAALTRYGSPIEGAATDPELYKLDDKIRKLDIWRDELRRLR